MDERPLSEPLGLYGRWELQRWSVQDIDLGADSRQWPCLRREERERLRHLLSLFTFGERAVTDALSPVLHAAPRSDERIFLATQLADEAQHVMFFRRFAADVVDEPVTGDAPGSDGFRALFHPHLAEAVDRVRVAPHDLAAWSEAVVTYHLVIEGYLALGGQRNLLSLLRATDRLPGLARGLVAIARDESRHVGYGLVALRRRVAECGTLAAVVADRLLLLAGPAMDALVDAIAALRAPDARAAPPGTGIDEMRRFVLDSLAGRLRLIGLPEATTAGVVAGYRTQLKDALTRRRIAP